MAFRFLVGIVVPVVMNVKTNGAVEQYTAIKNHPKGNFARFVWMCVVLFCLTSIATHQNPLFIFFQLSALNVFNTFWSHWMAQLQLMMMHKTKNTDNNFDALCALFYTFTDERHHQREQSIWRQNRFDLKHKHLSVLLTNAISYFVCACVLFRLFCRCKSVTRNEKKIYVSWIGEREKNAMIVALVLCQWSSRE